MSQTYKNKIIDGLKNTVDAQQELIERYEVALQFYAYDALSMKDDGEVARKVLSD